MSEFFYILGIFAIFLTALSAILYFIGFTRNSKAYKIFTLYLLLISIIQITAYFIGKGWLGKPNLFLSHFYFVIQFVYLSFFYYELLRYRFIKYVIIPVLIFIACQFIIDPDIFFRYNPLGATVTQFVLVVYTILYFYKNLTEKGEFIIVNMGFFFYLISSTLIFASGNLVLDLNISEDTRFILLNVNRVLTLFIQILIFTEWYRNYRKKPVIT